MGLHKGEWHNKGQLNLLKQKMVTILNSYVIDLVHMTLLEYSAIHERSKSNVHLPALCIVLKGPRIIVFKLPFYTEQLG